MLKILRDNMQGKDIVLFGTGNIAKEFYTKYKNIAKIKYFTSNGSSEFFDLEKMDISDVYKQKNVFIVLCCSLDDIRYKLERQLQDNGMEYLKNYVDYDLAEAAMDNEKEKVMLFIGVCHQQIVCNCISRCSNVFGVFIHRNLIFSDDCVQVRKKIDIISNYAICIVIPTMHDDVELNKLCKQLDDRTTIVSMPFIYYSLYFLQSNWFMHGPYQQDEMFLRNVISYRVDIQPYLYYLFDDDNLVSMVKKNMTTSEIVSTVSDENFYSKEYVDKMLKRTLRLIEISEQQSDIKICDWMIDNYKKIKIYRDKYHFNNQLIYEYAKRIMNYLGCSDINLDYRDVISYMGEKRGRMWLYEMPIYPSVARHLELQFVNEQTTYCVLKSHHEKQMIFRDVIEDKVECLKLIINLKEHL